VSRSHKNRPAARAGVGASCVHTPAGPWRCWLDFLAQRFPAVSRAQWEQRLQAQEVLDENGTPVAGDARYVAATRLYYFRKVDDEVPIDCQESIVWEDEHLVIADKPHFLPVIPSGKYVRETLLVRLKDRLQSETLVPVHRIDRDTAGLVMFSRHPASRGVYHALFRERQMHKVYHGIAAWNPDLDWPLCRSSRMVAAAHFMQQTEEPGEPNAVTWIRPLEVAHGLALYELKPLSGQRHQLRVHMNALGLPLLGDGIYPRLTPEGSQDFSRPLQLLAKSLRFTDPLSGVERQFDSAQRLDLRQALQRFPRAP